NAEVDAFVAEREVEAGREIRMWVADLYLIGIGDGAVAIGVYKNNITGLRGFQYAMPTGTVVCYLLVRLENPIGFESVEIANRITDLRTVHGQGALAQYVGVTLDKFLGVID